MNQETLITGASLIKHIRNEYPKESVFGVSLKDDFVVGSGITSQLILKKCGKEAWRLIGDYLAQNNGRWAAGYIGYDILKEEITTNSLPTVHLINPDTVFKVNKSGIAYSLIGGLKSINLASIKPKEFNFKASLSLTNFETDLDKGYYANFSKARDWVIQGKDNRRRMTLSRRIDFSESFDLVHSIVPFHNEPQTSVPCFWKSDLIEFAGISPERTFYKEAASEIYNFQKVSGTYVRDYNPSLDSSLLESFLCDIKNNNEHDISVASLLGSIGEIGNVYNTHKGILTLPKIRHFLTKFDLKPYKHKNVVDICEALFSKGVYPEVEGLKELFKVELISRGPYYGMFFVQTPFGVVMGVHIIRMLFHDLISKNYYTHCGSCITALSDLSDEFEETRLKLSSIVAHSH